MPARLADVRGDLADVDVAEVGVFKYYIAQVIR